MICRSSGLPAPGERLVDVFRLEQRGERQRRVAQPAVAVVPVAKPADPLRQRRRRRGHDSARRRVGERFQHRQRAVEQIAPFLWQRHLAAGVPLAPEALGLGERHFGVDARGLGIVRRVPREREGHALALLDRELGDRPHVLAAGVRRGAKAERIRPRDRLPRVVDASNPRDDVAVVEADHELRPHRHLPPHSLDDSNHVGRLAARRHEVDDGRRAGVGLEDSFEDEGAVAVGPPAGADVPGGGEQPAAVVGSAQQGGEAGAGVEAGEAEPIDRPAALDERRGLQVADQCVVLDPLHQRLSISRPSGGQRFCTARLNAASYSSALSSSRVPANAQRISASASVAASTTST